MRKSLRASVLVLALCAPAFAGDIPNPLPPEPPPTKVEAPPAAAGQMQDGAAGGFTEAVLTIIESVLALF